MTSFYINSTPPQRIDREKVPAITGIKLPIDSKGQQISLPKEIAIQILSYITPSTILDVCQPGKTPYMLLDLRRTSKAWDKIVQYILQENSMPSFFKNPQDFSYKDYLRSLQLPYTFQEMKLKLHRAEIPCAENYLCTIMEDDLLVTMGKFITFYDMNTLEPIAMLKKPQEIEYIMYATLTTETLIINTRKRDRTTALYSWDLKKNGHGLDVTFKEESSLLRNAGLKLPQSSVVHPDVITQLNYFPMDIKNAKFCPDEGIILVIRNCSYYCCLSAYNIKTGKEEWKVKNASSSLEILGVNGGKVLCGVHSSSTTLIHYSFYDIKTGACIRQFDLNYRSEGPALSFTNRGLILRDYSIYQNETISKIVLYTNHKLSEPSSDYLKNGLPNSPALRSFAYSLSKTIVVTWLKVIAAGAICGIITGIAMTILAALFPAAMLNPNVSSPLALGFLIFKISVAVTAILGPFKAWDEIKALTKLGVAVVTQQMLRLLPDYSLVKRALGLALWLLDYRSLRIKLMTKKLVANRLTDTAIQKLKDDKCHFICPISQEVVRKTVKIDGKVYDYDSLIFFYELHGLLPRFSTPKTLADIAIDTGLETQITAALA
jgi:hypothetical protein